MITAIILQIILIFLNAVFAGAEIAVISINDSRLEALVEKGDKRAKTISKITENPSKFLSTIQVAITLASLLGSAYAADSFADPLVAWLMSLGIAVPANTLHVICVLLITIILSFFSIVFGELVPKRIAMKNAEKMALGISGLLKFVSVAFAPFVWVLTKSTNGMLRLFKIDPNEHDEAVTEEEIRFMLDSGSERGTIDSLEHEMIQNVFEFDDISVSEVCTHRLDVVFLHIDDSIDEWNRIIKETSYTFYPVCGENTDDIIGVLSAKKYLRLDIKSVDQALKQAVEKAFFVPVNTKADILFTNMKRERNYFAVVVDEYGGTHGIITMHDLLELLVGDLFDKGETEQPPIKKTGDNKWEILGCASLEEVQQQLGITIEAEDCDTFGGYILGILGSVPDDGEKVELDTDDLHIKVVSVEEHRIEKTVALRKEKEEEE